MSKQVYLVYAPKKELGDHGFEMVTPVVSVFDDCEMAGEEMHRLMEIHDCEWCVDTLTLNQPHAKE